MELVGRKVTQIPDEAESTPLSSSAIPNESPIREAVSMAMEESPAYLRVRGEEKQKVLSTLDSLPKYSDTDSRKLIGWYIQSEDIFVKLHYEILD